MNKHAPDPALTLRDSLERKLILTLCAAALLFSVIAGAAQFTRNYTQEMQRSRTALDNLAATVHSSASIAAFVSNDAIANDVVEGLLRNAEILAVSLESNSGYHVLRWKNPSAPIWHKEDVVSYTLLSPSGGREPIGTLAIFTDANLISARARSAAFIQLGTLVMQTAIIALIMLFAFRRLIGHPLSKLTSQLHSVVPGSSQRINIDPEQDGTEIGLLATSLNLYLEASEQAIHAERQLRLRVETMENHYRRIFDSTNVGVMVLEMDGTLVSCNAVLRERILCAPPGVWNPADDAPRIDFLSFAFKHPDKAWVLVERAHSSHRVEEEDLEINHANGRARWVHCLFSTHTPEGGGSYFIECVLYDVTSRREREQMAIRSAERDTLTDLVNRRGAEAYLERAIRDAHNANLEFAVLSIDLDGFKGANDTFGHAGGDAVLIEIARRFGKAMRRSSDLLARMGGDEFLIVAYDCSKHSIVVRELAERLISAMADPFHFDNGGSMFIGASIGIAGYPEDGTQQETLLQIADQAMYEVKRSGKNRYAYARTEPASAHTRST